MDPPLISEGSFSTENPSMAEIWPFNNGGDAGMLGLRMGSGSGFASGFIDSLLNGQMNRDVSLEESTVTDQSASFGANNPRKRRDNVSEEDESSKLVSTTSSGHELKESNGKRSRTSNSREENVSLQAGGNTSSVKDEKSADPLKDYIHVRARRGQATDSHSLAERARREKISERMKILQDLVPGCNKVIGKALVLDEIINYIQSLQRQVEFLSMKLEAVNTRIISTSGGFHSKDVNQLGVPSFDPSGMMLSAQAREFLAVAAEAAGGPQAEWLHMQLGGGFERST